MEGYDSDSSGGEDVATKVLLGYASKELTSDSFSQLGGYPAWLDEVTRPSATFARCKVCNGWMSLLLQLHGDLLTQFPSHERRLYVWACKRKACRRKQGSIRGFRSIRMNSTPSSASILQTPVATESKADNSGVKPRVDLGASLFGAKSPSSTQANPFAMSSNGSNSVNPFASASSMAAKPAQKPAANESLAQTFAEKARIAAPAPSQPEAKAPEATEPWPEESAFPMPYPAYSVDADTEYLEPESQDVLANARLDRSNGEGSSGGAEDKVLFESSMDKTFQRFADRLSQNPEQVLRYEFSGQPLLYSRTDAVGKLLATEQEHWNAKVQTTQHTGGAGTTKIPRCTNCGASRVFELQLTPHAITELEADDLSLDGMDWGTIILYVCSADCQVKVKTLGEVGYLEEWVGVQWEEMADKPRK